jgi:excisionase family DNA binding protein
MNIKKRVLQIESWQIDDFIETISTRVAQKLVYDYDCCLSNESRFTPSKEVLWLTSSEVCEKLSVSRPTLKAMRERGEVEFIKLGRSYRYNIWL